MISSVLLLQWSVHCSNLIFKFNPSLDISLIYLQTEVEVQGDDPRVGTGRVDSELGDLQLKSSFTPILVTIVPVFVYLTACWALFLFLRRKYPRVYAPRTIPGITLPT
jgi:hypothetical protein